MRGGPKLGSLALELTWIMGAFRHIKNTTGLGSKKTSAGSFDLIFTQLLANLFSFTDSRTTPRCIFAETGGMGCTIVRGLKGTVWANGGRTETWFSCIGVFKIHELYKIHELAIQVSPPSCFAIRFTSTWTPILPAQFCIQI